MNSNNTVHLFHLAKSEYHANRGWVCTLLSIPGATVTNLRMGGVTIPLERLCITAPYIRIVDDQQTRVQDADVAVSIPAASNGKISTPIVVALITLFGVMFGALLNYVKDSRPLVFQDSVNVQKEIRTPVQEHDATNLTKGPEIYSR